MSSEFEINVCFVGAGYVGGPTAAVMAKFCPTIKFQVVDLDRRRIDGWNSDVLPIYEPGLQELVEAMRGKNLFFSTDVGKGIDAADIIMVAVNTPIKTFGLAGAGYDLAAYESVSRAIAQYSNSSKIVVEKSTVPVRTAERMRQIFDANKKSSDIHLEILSNPEFLAEGTAIKNLENPDRVLIGGMETPEGQAAINTLAQVYKKWVPPNKIITTNLWSSELGKLASNAMLAQRISSMNSMSALCEASGANVDEIKKIVGSDPRIGSQFLNASVGFGGSCLEKDLLGLIYLCESYHLDEVADYWRSVLKINEYQKSRFAKNIVARMFDNVKGKNIAIYGFAFKKDTGDIRLSPAIDICRALLKEGARLFIYDPKASHVEMIAEFPASQGFQQERISLERNPYTCATETHAICVLTDWNDFKSLDYERIFRSMQKPAFIFDGRNLLDSAKLKSIGFHVVSIGKN
eukprot:TRINITY_DN2935_c0_g1_i1.p1 TRINITY_DN2935_c0_g1~~TRINITY_DN2935_c0_g1_i1.p1  ORF type:complete len:462 (+),score=110.68 TRINITY_DN2935_c0_g1_i1:50-1435(+)